MTFEVLWLTHNQPSGVVEPSLKALGVVDHPPNGLEGVTNHAPPPPNYSLLKKKKYY
jgi:hypothetical protein